jgi:sugar lactone lactonase YvrE
MRRLSFIAIAAVILAGCAGENGDNPNARVWGTGEAELIDGSPTNARFNNPVNVETAPDGTVYVCDFDNDAVRIIGTNGQVSTLFNDPTFQRPFGITLGANGNLYVQTDGNDLGQRDSSTGTIWQIDRLTGSATVVQRNIGRPRGLLALSDGRIVMSDIVQNTIRILYPDGAITTIAGLFNTPGFQNGSGSEARFDRPYGMALYQGDILVADQNNNVIRRVTLGGTVSTFAGRGAAGNFDGSLSIATFNHPTDVTVIGDTVYVADHDNHVIRKIRDGSVTTILGNGTAGFVDADGLNAEFFGMEGITVSPDGSHLWIADGNNGDGGPSNRVRKMAL